MATASRGAPGYEASADYVAEVAADAGLDVSFHEFDYDLDLLADWEAPRLRIVDGAPAQDFVAGIAGAQFGGDFGSMYDEDPYAVDLTAPVWAADVNLDPDEEDPSNTSGCQAADYAGMPQGAIVLLQYSEACTLGTKFFGAQQMGAGAIVFFDAGTEGATERSG